MKRELLFAVVVLGLVVPSRPAMAERCPGVEVHRAQAIQHNQDAQGFLVAAVVLGLATGGLFFATAKGAVGANPLNIEEAENIATRGTILTVLSTISGGATGITAIGAGVRFDLERSNHELADRWEKRCLPAGDFQPRLPEGLQLPSNQQEPADGSSEGMLESTDPDPESASPKARDEADPAERCRALRSRIEALASRAEVEEATGKRMVDDALRREDCLD